MRVRALTGWTAVLAPHCHVEQVHPARRVTAAEVIDADMSRHDGASVYSAASFSAADGAAIVPLGAEDRLVGDLASAPPLPH